jgi:RNA polymerase sigma factor (sigma-70 family)
VLTRRFGVRHWGLVEDVVQYALTRALTAWAFGGIPDNPAAWLHRVAQNRARDLLRRDLRWNALGPDRPAPPTPEPEPPDDRELRDDLLRMIFVCCDPAVPEESQVALALRTLCGFGAAEIARALLTTEANVLKRIVRAKERLRERGVDPSRLGADDIRHRLPTALAVLYLLFNEGYSSSRPDRLIRQDLCEEAVRLALLLAEHPLTAGTETAAFLALLLFHAARLNERLDAAGELLLIEHQDRTRWDRRLLDEAYRWFARATQGDHVSRYHAEAWIAAEHCRAAEWGDTNWDRIVAAYDLLHELAPSPIHALNRAIAVAKLRGPAAGLAALDAEAEMPDNYYLVHATRALFEGQLGSHGAARSSLQRAATLAPTDAEKRLLLARILELALQPAAPPPPPCVA